MYTPRLLINHESSFLTTPWRTGRSRGEINPHGKQPSQGDFKAGDHAQLRKTPALISTSL